MNLHNLISSYTGLIHLVFSILALVLGAFVLSLRKGSLVHKRLGYLYTFSMVGVIITAFMIYRLFGRFGMFHWLAIVSTVTLLSGLLPILLKKPKSYLSLHYGFMYWSVIGLYGAFVAETFVRFPDVVMVDGIPNVVFYKMTGVAIAITMGLGAYFFIKKSKKWEKFNQEINGS